MREGVVDLPQCLRRGSRLPVQSDTQADEYIQRNVLLCSGSQQAWLPVTVVKALFPLQRLALCGQLCAVLTKKREIGSGP